MSLRRIFLPTLATALVGLLTWPSTTRGFVTSGDVLALDQRDVRVFNSFLDTSANNDTAFDPQFPGFFGAERALWKGIVEWGSGPHGDGSGDPTQANLGDGGANFDPSWQGRASAPGGTNENVISATSTNPQCLGVLAFTEIPTTDGWRITFCDFWDWHDGPGLISGFSTDFDIQSLGAHEYGHALGLGHSSDPSATMRAATPSGSIEGRSLAADDIAGIQMIYGRMSATKPLVTQISGGDPIVIEGLNFAGSGNEVWFTRGTPGGNGDPVKVLNLPSAMGGTRITVSVPTDAGPGDVLVHAPGTTHDTLSNAFPFNPVPDPPEVYCSGKVTSEFCFPFASATGFASATDTSRFMLRGEDVTADQAGLLVYGLNGRGFIPYHNARICVKAPLTRTLRFRTSDNDGSASCAGTLRIDFNRRIQRGLDPSLIVGTWVNAQWIFRDPGVDAFNDGLTSAIEFVIEP